MRIEGFLSKWNDDRGFGFITPTAGGQEVFVHISAFPKDGLRPVPGEKLTFEVETGDQGRPRARNLLFPMRPVVTRAPSRKPASGRRKTGTGFLNRMISLIIFVGLGLYGYREYSRHVGPLDGAVFSHLPALASRIVASEPGIREIQPSYSCDGRTYCSQMTSCAEATFFLKNCPDVQMDGDHDGVPCEQQWCNN